MMSVGLQATKPFNRVINQFFLTQIKINVQHSTASNSPAEINESVQRASNQQEIPPEKGRKVSFKEQVVGK
jgi:hypothetical protein